MVTLKSCHERNRKGLESLVEFLQGALATDRVAEEHREKIDHLIAPKTLPRKAHLLIDLVQNTMLAKRSANHHDFAKPARGRGVGFRSRLDFYRRVGDTSHAYLLGENDCLFSHQGGTFLRRLATGHTSLRIAWVPRYREGEIRYDHIHEIMNEYGYHDFASQPEHFRFLRWLYTRAWWSEERLTVLFDLSMAQMIERKVLLPGVSVLERLVSRVRERASERLWRLLAQIPTPRHVALLETLLVVPQGERQTPLDRLRRRPSRVSGPALVTTLHRVDAIHLFEVEHLDLSFVPKGRIKALARYTTTALVYNLRQLADDHRVATLLAFAHTSLATVHDDALDIFDALMRTTSSQATREGQQERLRTIHDLDAAAQVLSEACQVVLDETQDPTTLLTRIYARVSASHLQAAVTTVGELTRPPDDTYAQELMGRYLMMRRFLPTLFRTLTFESTPSGRPTLEAVQFLQHIEGRSRASLQAAPREVIPRSWQRYVLPRRIPPENGQPEVQVERPAYTVCVVERLHESLRRHDVFVDPSERWGDPRAKLLQGEQWEGIRVQICQTLGREVSFAPELERLGQQLEEAYRRTISHLPTNAAV